MREMDISTVNLSGGSQSVLPNQCWPYGRQKVRHHMQTNKEVRTNIMINWWLCPSQQPAGLNYWQQVCIEARKRSLHGKIWEDKRVMFQNMTPTTWGKKSVECVYSYKSIAYKRYRELISPPAFWNYEDMRQILNYIFFIYFFHKDKWELHWGGKIVTISKHQAGRKHKSNVDNR